jgi:ApbE superfamily uncharacterized protein (UPF0280 family)
MYEPRIYRHWIKDRDLVSFTAIVRETDLHIRAHSNLKSYALKAIKKYRKPLEKYIENHPLFLHSLKPFDVEDDAPELIKNMANAARVVGVGPMAAVAGAIAEAVGKDLLTYSPEVIVENGGDIFMKSLKKRLIGIYAGSSPFTGKIALEIEPGDVPLGICTSSGTVGHSLSLGSADAVIVLSSSTALADAAATAIGNHIKSAEDIEIEIERASHMHGLSGLVIIKDDKIGLWGKVKLVSTSTDVGN